MGTLGIIRNLVKGLKKDSRGQSTVEIVMIAPLILLMTTVGFDMGRAAYIQHKLMNAVYEGLKAVPTSYVHNPNLINCDTTTKDESGQELETLCKVVKARISDAFEKAGITKPAVFPITFDFSDGRNIHVTLTYDYSYLIGKGFGVTKLTFDKKIPYQAWVENPIDGSVNCKIAFAGSTSSTSFCKP